MQIAKNNALLLLFLLVSTWGRAEVQFTQFENELGDLRKTHLLPGFAAAVVKDNQVIWSQGYGFADNNNEVPVTPDTPFWIASATMAFVGLNYLYLTHSRRKA